MNKGKLFMLPVPIADGVLNDTLPEHRFKRLVNSSSF